MEAPETGRQLFAFGVGASKSGTHSLASLFSGHYRSVHEPESAVLIGLITAIADGDRPHRDLVNYLTEKDARLRLEMDSSSLNGEVIEALVDLHPDAHYILTIRHPFDWLDSKANHGLAHPTPEHWKPFRDLRFGALATADHPPAEHELAIRGLHTLDGYLGHWVHHNQRVLDTVAPERLLVIRTDQLTASVDRIARFIGVDPETLQRDRAHEFPAAEKFAVLDLLDADYLEERIRHHCGPLIDRFFDGVVVPRVADGAPGPRR